MEPKLRIASYPTVPLSERLLLLAEKFSTKRYLQTDDEGKEFLRDNGQRVKTMVREMAEKMTPEMCAKLHISNPKPLGAGLNGFVFASSAPGVVIKVAFDMNDAIMAEKVMKMEKGLSCLPRVYKVLKYVRLYEGAMEAHLIYLEQLRKLPVKVAKSLEMMLDDVILADDHTAKRYSPKQYMQALQHVVEKAPDGSTLQWTARQLQLILRELAGQQWWHIDLHSENFCLGVDGEGNKRLKMIDLGSLLDPSEVAKMWGPIAFPQQATTARVRTAARSQLSTQLLSLRPLLAKAAQGVYDEWAPDGDDGDELLGAGGICDQVADAMADVLSSHGIETTTGGHDGDDHAYLIAYDDTRAFSVDIHPEVYETGGGYKWTKRPNVTIEPNDVDVSPVDRSDLVDSEGNIREASVSQRLLKLVASTPAERRKRINSHEDLALWDALQKLGPAWRKWGYRMTVSKYRYVQFLYRDTDIRINVVPRLRELSLVFRSDEIDRPKFAYKKDVQLADGSSAYERDGYRDAQEKLKDLNREYDGGIRFGYDWDATAKARAIVAALADMRPQLDLFETYIAMTEASSEH